MTGVGGFGEKHVAAAEALAEEGLVELVAFAEPNETLPLVEKLRAQGLRHYRDYYEMISAESELDLVCLATPIPHHYLMTMAAFEQGLHVFLEKPPAVLIQDLINMIALQEEQDCYCVVDFEDVARSLVVTLKNRMCEGALGKVLAIHAEARWTRPDTYYSRNNWAGKCRLEGDFVLDGPMNNACAHVLNMAAYLAGSQPHEFAKPVHVQGELYRANDIEGEDTNCLRAVMDTDVEVCIHLTQCAATRHARSYCVIGEDGAALCHDQHGLIFPDENIEEPAGENPKAVLLRRLVEVINGSDEPLLMPLAESEGFLLLSNGAYESSRRIHPIPSEYTLRVPRDGTMAMVIQDIDMVMLEAAAEGKLLSEFQVPWAVITQPFDLTDYTAFPKRWQE